ncbi:MAG TPA: OmpA family protein [Acidobacteriaceae bacterium]|nr:OmpA family protein [Acidobacteriaceae bacterium]
MKSRYWLPMVLIGCVLGAAVPAAHSQSIMDRIKAKAKAKVDQKEDNAASTAVNAADPTNGGTSSKNASSASSSTTSGSSATTTGNAGNTAAAAPSGGAPNVPTSIAAYQSYDFVPGEKILFADDFTTTPDGEFPSQWEMDKGQAVVNQQAGYEAFAITAGSYGTVNPRMKTKNYLPEQFTVECDYFSVPGAEPLRIFFRHQNESAQLVTGRRELKYYADGVDLTSSPPASIRDQAFDNKWHHIAVAYHNQQMKLYIDQYRVMTIPDTKLSPEWVQFGGSGDQEKPIIFKNVRIAAGGGMNMIGRKFTEAKIVTHGINFDVDQATIRPESMGVLNQIKAVMTSDPSLKFEIDGHTDNSGDAAHNQALSQERAEAVKAQLVSMGISEDRLTTKGYGDTKPMASNDTPDGKANNRRVEFVKTS